MAAEHPIPSKLMAQRFASRVFRADYVNAWGLLEPERGIALLYNICNLGLNAILSISIPVLNAIYPISIVLILLGMSHKLWQSNRHAYPFVITGTGCVSVLYALDAAGLPLGFLSRLCRALPLYDMGFWWVIVAVVMLLASLLVYKLRGAK